MNAIAVTNPLSQKSLYTIDETSETQAETIFDQARSAFSVLQQTTVKERLHELAKVRQSIFDQQEIIVDKVMAETGKSRTDALVSEVLGVLDYIDWLIKNGVKILADEKVASPLSLLGKKSKILHQPLGVVLVISPWNYPFHIGMTTLLAALVAGNAVVFKPSEITPLSGLFESILSVSTLLKNSLFIAYGSGATAQCLIDQQPGKIFFTGSAKTGKKILKQAAEYLVPVDLELGGKDQMIVFDDVNIGRTVAGCLWGGMTNAGQSCTSVERVYVHRKIYESFKLALKVEAEKLVMNGGDRGDADLGGITADFQLNIIQRQVLEAKQKGATIICGGGLLGGQGRFYLPTLLDQTTADMAVLSEETFGPVLVIMPFDSEEEVVRISNDSPFGLSASVWSKDLKRAERVARKLEAGAISINNVMLTEGNPALPFGGTKQSGFGRVKGAEGLLGMTCSKSVLTDKQSTKIEANWYPYTRQKYALFQQFILALSSRGWRKWLRFAITGLKLESQAQKPR